MATSQQTIRRWVMTGSVAAITATGVWYGAGLKMQQEAKQAIRKHREATAEEKIALLEEQRSTLVAKRIGLERKLQEIEARANGATMAESKVGMERKRP
ncbi:hypothetical protein B7463_g5677, partial [Scytalidium lignicola]